VFFDSDFETRAPSWALVKRELIAHLRRGRSYLYLFLFMAVALIYLYQVYPSPLPGQIINQNQAADFANRLVENVQLLLYAACFIFIPGLAGASISVEKETRIYDQLHLSLISPSGIFFAKTLNAAGFFMLLAIAALPAASIVFFMPGVDFARLVTLFLNLIAIALASASVGVLCSSLIGRTSVALIASYSSALLVALIGLAFVEAMWLIPAGMARSGVFPDNFEIFFKFGLTVLFSSVVIVIAHLIAASALKRPPRQAVHAPVRQAAARPRRQGKQGRFTRWLSELIDRDQAIQDQLNPVFVKELRLGMDGGQLVATILLFYIGFVVYASTSLGFLLPAIIGGKGGGLAESIGTPILIHAGFAVFCAPSLLANALTKEGEAGNLDMLRMTLVPPWQVVLGKLTSGLVTMTPLLAASILTCVPLALIAFPSINGLFSIFAAVSTLMLCAMLSLCLGLFASALTSRTITAVLISYGLNAFVFVGASALLAMLEEMKLPGISEEMIMFFSPILAFGHNVDHGVPSLFNMYWIANFTLYSTLTLLLFLVTVKLFTSYRMRRGR